ncbi:MAG: phosphoadenosine phosphosulfate reductase family protein, partial [Sphingomonadaceae bacterium]
MTVALTGGQLAAPVPLLDLKSYDRIVIALSGGKDSVASTLALLEAGARAEQLMFIHHEVDGREGGSMMDWGATPGYCQAFAGHFHAPLISSWREGGFEGEMLRNNATTGAVNFE